jgi:exo-beta-1,3-glucanase (GH17 family)
MNQLKAQPMKFARIQATVGHHGRRAATALSLVLVMGFALVVAGCGGGGTTPVSGVQVRPLSAEYSSRKAVSYSPYRTATSVSGLAAETISTANIKQDLDLLLAGGFGLIRLFDSSDKVAKATLQVIRDNKLNLKVQLGAYIQSGDSAYNNAEVARAVALANLYSDIVLAVSVGNENMVSWSFNRVSPEEMAGYLSKVRGQISQPVTTDDNYAFWASATNTITDVIDFASLHTYVLLDTYFDPGKWDWQQKAVPAAQRATAMMDAALVASKAQYDAARAHLDRKGLSNIPITIGETGWNAVDLGRLAFRAHPVNQKMYFDRLTAWAAEGRQGAGPKAIFYFEAFDEPWKQGDDKWGLFNVQRQARYVIQGLNAPSATWVWEPGSYAASDAVYFAPAVANAAVTQTKYTLFSEAALTASELRPTDLRWDAFDGNSVNAPEVTTTAAPGDGSKSIEITPQPKDYGWGFLNQSATTPVSTANLSNFAASGSLRFSIKTTYAGKIEIGISSDTADRVTQEAYLQIGNGDYGYCNTGAWCTVTIPLTAFKTANPNLDLSLVLSRFIIADRYSFTGKATNANITTKLNIDAIYWSR